MNPYENLANAIILQAVKDYRDLAMWLNVHRPLCEEDEQNNDYISALADKRSIEQFFLDGWFSALTNLDGKALLEKLKCEVV